MTKSHLFSRLSLAALVAGGLAIAAPAHALTAKECRAAFNKAKADGTLNGQKYRAFKAAQCAVKAKTADAAAMDAKPDATPKVPESRTVGGAPLSTPSTGPVNTGSAPTAATASAGNVVFPTAVSAQYANLSAGRARQKTCVAQYNANKATGGNGSLKWIQRGGGYWSQCNARLKGGK